MTISTLIKQKHLIGVAYISRGLALYHHGMTWLSAGTHDGGEVTESYILTLFLQRTLINTVLIVTFSYIECILIIFSPLLSSLDPPHSCCHFLFSDSPPPILNFFVYICVCLVTKEFN